MGPSKHGASAWGLGEYTGVTQLLKLTPLTTMMTSIFLAMEFFQVVNTAC